MKWYTVIIRHIEEPNARWGNTQLFLQRALEHVPEKYGIRAENKSMFNRLQLLA